MTNPLTFLAWLWKFGIRSRKPIYLIQVHVAPSPVHPLDRKIYAGFANVFVNLDDRRRAQQVAVDHLRANDWSIGSLHGVHRLIRSEIQDEELLRWFDETKQNGIFSDVCPYAEGQQSTSKFYFFRPFELEQNPKIQGSLNAAIKGQLQDVD